MAFGRLNESRGGAPKGERASQSALPHPYDAAKGRLRLSALRLPSFPGGLFDMVDKTKWWTKLGRKARREDEERCVRETLVSSAAATAGYMAILSSSHPNNATRKAAMLR